VHEQPQIPQYKLTLNLASVGCMKPWSHLGENLLQPGPGTPAPAGGDTVLVEVVVVGVTACGLFSVQLLAR
jgi:hypothetical protein